MSAYVVHKTGAWVDRYKVERNGYVVTWTITLWGARHAIAADRRSRTIVKHNVYTEED